MADRTAISWADATLNWWWSCQEVSPGCDNCYARTLARRRGVGWGPQAERVKIEGAPYLACRLQRRAVREGRRLRVFTNSMSDFFDAKVPQEWRHDAWAHMAISPNIDWLILTKRPKSIPSMLPSDWGDGYPNVWLGTSVENADYLWRISELLQVPAALRWISAEPLLGPLDFDQDGKRHLLGPASQAKGMNDGLDWVVVGGESGPDYRRMDVSWLESIVDQCREAQVPVWVKQDSGRYPERMGRIPPEYRIQELPRRG